MRSFLRRGALTAGAFTLALGVISPAVADTFEHRDARHDVARARHGHEVQHAPENRQYDVTALQVHHGMKSIRFQVSLRSTALSGRDQRRLSFTMKTRAHTYSGFWISDKHGLIDAEVRDDTAHTRLGCAQSGRRKGHVMWWTIPTACFDDPQWIRVAFSVTGRSHGVVYRDNALSHSWRHARKSVYSSRIRASL